MPTARAAKKPRTTKAPRRPAKCFTRPFPPEVLLLVFEHLSPRHAHPAAVRAALAALRAVCLASKALSRLGTPVLYGCVCVGSCGRAERFVRTAESERWASGEMKGKMKVYVEGLRLENFDQLGMVDRVLGVVDPAKITSLEVGNCFVNLASLAPLTNLRRLGLEASRLVFDQEPTNMSLPRATHLALCDVACIRPINQGDDPAESEAHAAEDWDAFLCPAMFPALASLAIDTVTPIAFAQGVSRSAPLLQLLGQLTALASCEDYVRLDTQSPATWAALKRLKHLSLSTPAESDWSNPVPLHLALAHLPTSLARLDLSRTSFHRYEASWLSLSIGGGGDLDERTRAKGDFERPPPAGAIVRDAVERGLASVAELREVALVGKVRRANGRVVKPDKRTEEYIRAVEETVKDGSGGRIRVERVCVEG